VFPGIPLILVIFIVGLGTSRPFNFTGYTMAALLFIAVTIPLARVTDWLIERDRRRMRATSG
jgi:hypothetical protein